MAPRVSIVIPVYNSAKYLRECLDSICNQSFKDWEIVAVDDGSPDESPAILDEYAARDSRIRVIHKPNGGVSAARNDGLAAAIGEYVLFVDSDDWLEADALRNMFEASESGKADVVITDHFVWKESFAGKTDVVEPVCNFFAQGFLTDSRDVIGRIQSTVLYRGYSPYPSATCGYMFSALWTKLIRRSILTDHEIRFNGLLKLYEDGLVALQVFQQAKVVAYRPVPTYHYRILNNSLCHINEDRLVSDSANILAEVKNFIDVSGAAHLQDAYLARALFLTKKMALRSFFCRGSKGSFLSRYKAFKDVLAAEPYCAAVASAGKLKLCGNERSYGKLVGRGLYFAVALMYELRSKIKRH
ncbi:MAG: glycosyltransferase [Fibrobacter sp.]|nr:glycosyltransferase [Fibrobacter sp.]